MAYLIEIKSLSASYENNVVLQNIDFRVNENDFIGVIGPNGGGKTTLLKVILGLIRPSAGSIVFNSDLISANTIGYLPQISTGDNNYPVTVTDVILSGMMIRKKIITRMSASDKKRAAEVIDELGLAAMAHSSLNELSGGQLQRVFLGRAIIGNPMLLLLDEPGSLEV